jgi:CO/xanthine dehydrogenase Mo-binding subunit
MSNPTGIGVSVRRKEDMRFITGRGNYVADVKRPDMAFGVFLRSPHAHARIKSIDTSLARSMPGVVKVLTGEDLRPTASADCRVPGRSRARTARPAKSLHTLRWRKGRYAASAMPWRSSSRTR